VFTGTISPVILILAKAGDLRMKSVVIGRKQERVLLHQLYMRVDPDFLAIYGRRRVGKTYLIRNFFSHVPCLYFETTGLKNGSLRKQLKLFVDKLISTFSIEIPLEMPKNWLDAFHLLQGCIEKISKKEKVVLFFDELPWLATPKSGFIQALDYYWNTYWSRRQNLKVVVCGSAASWMLENLIRAKGGLHNRLTAVMSLKPFTLAEAEEYLQSRGVQLNRRQVLELYMAMGGIPHYLNAAQSHLSVAQNVNRICFSKDGLLFSEFNILFSSLFDNSSAHIELIRLISSSRYGVDRDTLLSKTKHSSSGGRFKARLSELEEAGFIIGFTPQMNRKKGTFYRIIDEYTLFYLHWIEPVENSLKLSLQNSNYWESKMQSQAWKIWSGYAFEAICFKHIEQIKAALGIRAIASEIESWRHISKKNKGAGAQIDLLINRSDGIIDLCEIKYCQGEYKLTKKDAENLENKIQVYKTESQAQKSVLFVMITPEGIRENAHALRLIADEVVLNDLFQKEFIKSKHRN
jgi:hypothetical protein